MLDCPVCNNVGDTCLACGGRGEFELTQCPRKVVPADIWETLELASLAENGAWPELAGTLDQSASFTDAMNFIRGEKNRWESHFRNG